MVRLLRSALCLTFLLAAIPAQAQAVGFWGGGTIDPEQFFVGTFFESPRIGDAVNVRPGIDMNFIDDTQTATISIPFIYSSGEPSGWQFYTGGGPVIQIVPIDSIDSIDGTGGTDLSGGLMGLFGIGHGSGFFTEFQFGSDAVANLKFGAGFKIGGTP